MWFLNATAFFSLWLWETKPVGLLDTDSVHSLPFLFLTFLFFSFFFFYLCCLVFYSPLCCPLVLKDCHTITIVKLFLSFIIYNASALLVKHTSKRGPFWTEYVLTMRSRSAFLVQDACLAVVFIACSVLFHLCSLYPALPPFNPLFHQPSRTSSYFICLSELCFLVHLALPSLFLIVFLSSFLGSGPKGPMSCRTQG